MYNFCTLFDSSYLQKGLALYESLCNVCDEFHLYVVAFDDECHSLLKGLNFNNLTVISLSEFETSKLLDVKPTRNRAEYCWTSGPSVIYHCITFYGLDHCSYLDSDLMFYSSPKPIFSEIGEKSIAITEHFTEEIDELGGKYCVQFVYFRNDKDGMEALTWWRDQCIEWCFARFEDGKYGDQKYLDSFPLKFKNVCVLKNRGAGVAPWNASQYDFSQFGKIKYRSELIDIIFYHYHGIKIQFENKDLVLKTVTYDISKDVEENIYLPYLRLIKSISERFLNRHAEKIRVDKRSQIQQMYSLLKKLFRRNSVVQFLYYKVLKVKYNGYEKSK